MIRNVVSIFSSLSVFGPPHTRIDEDKPVVSQCHIDKFADFVEVCVPDVRLRADTEHIVVVQFNPRQLIGVGVDFTVHQIELHRHLTIVVLPPVFSFQFPKAKGQWHNFGGKVCH